MNSRNTRTRLHLLITVFCAVALQACATQGSGAYMPPGDAVKGREAYVALRCHACHEIAGFDPPATIVAENRVRLGGQNDSIRTYGDLVTSIANPSHRLARDYPPDAVTVDGVSLMSLIRLNEVMTVQQLIDLAAFLQTEYEVAPPPAELEDVYPSEDDVVRSEVPAI